MKVNDITKVKKSSSIHYLKITIEYLYLPRF